VTELSYAAGKAITDLPEGVRPGEVAKQHGYELAPGCESLSVSLCLVLDNELSEVPLAELLEKLIE